jgi:hypothetical protein
LEVLFVPAQLLTLGSRERPAEDELGTRRAEEVLQLCKRYGEGATVVEEQVAVHGVTHTKKWYARPRARDPEDIPVRAS